ncbi:hypothetical protein ACOMHN_022852 [Nucella lapillus]
MPDMTDFPLTAWTPVYTHGSAKSAVGNGPHPPHQETVVLPDCPVLSTGLTLHTRRQSSSLTARSCPQASPSTPGDSRPP